MVLLDPVGVVAEAAVGGPARGLDVGRLPGARAQDAEEGVRSHRPGADLDVVGRGQVAALAGPVGLEVQDQVLEAHTLFGFSHLTIGLRAAAVSSSRRT